MSYQRIDPGAPADLSNDSPFKNEEFVEALPYKQGVYVTRKACKRCDTDSWCYDLALDKCPKCGSPNSKVFKAGQRIYLQPQNVSAHHRRGLMTCWNQTEDPVSGEIKKHDFVEEKVPVITPLSITAIISGSSTPITDYEWHEEVRCEVCSMPYQRINGRKATADEVELFKNGKLGRSSKFLGQNWME